MATPRSQRIGIWVIAIVLAIGTVGTFLSIILENQNQATDQANLQKAYDQYQLESTAYTAKVNALTKKLSDEYYSVFKQYSSIPAAFSASSVKGLTKQDLKIGTGATIDTKTDYSAYYIGWNPKGVVFDQSIDKNSLKIPLTISAGSSMITGWMEGVLGMKINGVREISIPSSLAYGANGSGANIPANTPIKFIVFVIPKVNPIPTVQMPQILIDYYKSQQSGTQ
jgi:FKBP-type peptidyl-prolyl cis-trans isomerase